MITERSLFPEVEKVLTKLSSLESCYLIDWQDDQGGNALAFSDLLNHDQSNEVIPDFDEHTAAAIIHTSGTTGKPKSTILTYRQLSQHTINQ